MIFTIGVFFARWKQAAVSIERMDRLLQGAPPSALVRKTPIYLSGAFPSAHDASPVEAESLQGLSVAGLTYRFPGS